MELKHGQQNGNRRKLLFTEMDYLRREIKGKAIPVTVRLPHYLDNWLRDGGEVVSLRGPPLFTPTKFPRTHFC
jgi:hypothetical protein